MTRSPIANFVTPPPRASTVPAHSAAGENGSGGLVWYLLAMISVSKKFNAAALMRTTASPGAATGSGTSANSRSSGVPWRVQSSAFMTFQSLECGLVPRFYHGLRAADYRLHIADFHR